MRGPGADHEISRQVLQGGRRRTRTHVEQRGRTAPRASLRQGLVLGRRRPHPGPHRCARGARSATTGSGLDAGLTRQPPRRVSFRRPGTRFFAAGPNAPLTQPQSSTRAFRRTPAGPVEAGRPVAQGDRGPMPRQDPRRYAALGASWVWFVVEGSARADLRRPAATPDQRATSSTRQGGYAGGIGLAPIASVGRPAPPRIEQQTRRPLGVSPSAVA